MEFLGAARFWKVYFIGSLISLVAGVVMINVGYGYLFFILISNFGFYVSGKYHDKGQLFFDKENYTLYVDKTPYALSELVVEYGCIYFKGDLILRQSDYSGKTWRLVLELIEQGGMNDAMARSQ